MLFGLGRLHILLGLVKQVRPAGWRRRTILTVEVGKPSRPRDARRVVWLNARDTAGAFSGTMKTHVIQVVWAWALFTPGVRRRGSSCQLRTQFTVR